MTVKELIEELAEYPDTMTIVIEQNNTTWGALHYTIEQIEEDDQKPNTIVIKI